MKLQSLLAELETALGGSSVSVLPEALERASKDETHGLIPREPDVVVFPNSHDDVVKIATLCHKYQIAMTPRGAGTGKSGGCVPVSGGVVIDFTRLNRILEINKADMFAVVEPGVVLLDLQQEAEALGLFYPPDPASLEWCTIGGNVAENAGGPSAVKYGVTRDYVLGMRVVLSNGRSFRIGKKTIKGVTGLDLVSLIVGSEGVLAFVTEITLRLLPKPPCVLAAMLQFSNRESAIEAAGKVKASSAFPRSIEFMDSSSLLALQKSKLLPQALEGVAALLLVEVDGIDEASVLTALKRVEDSAQGVGFIGATVAVDERQRQNLWKIRRQLSEATKRLAKYKISEDIVVPLSRMKELLADVDSIAIKHDIATCAFGHAGDGNLHIQIFFNDEGTRKKLPQVLNELFEATIRHDGTLTGEHGIGIAKKPFLKLEQEDDLIELQKQLKKVFDPSGLLNPGKFL